MRQWGSAFALGVGLLAAACIPRFQEPVVQLAQIRLGSLGLTGGTVHAEFTVHNPNRFALAGTELTYDLALSDPATSAWIPLADGVMDTPFHVGAMDSARVELPVQFRYAGLGSALRSVLSSGAIAYRISGEVRVHEPVRRTVPYARTGTVVVMGER